MANRKKKTVQRSSAPARTTSLKADNQKMVVNQIVIRPITRKASDVDSWRNALQSADMGRVKQLYDLYEDLLIDGVLSDSVEKRIGAVTNAELSFQDADGSEVEEICALMDSPAWEEVLSTIMQTRFWGRSGIEFDFSNGFDAKPIPPKHIKIDNKCILINEYDDSGVPYENDDHILVLGKKRDFGLMLKTAPFAIYKRGGYGDYAQWLEIFGMPQRIGKYSSYDPESRKLLEDAFERSGSAPWVVIPKESEVQVIESSGGSGGKSPYDEFRKACNEEMLITILGQTMTTVQGDKGARSLGEVHKEVEEGKNKADMRFVQRVLNHFVLPILEKRGFPVTGGKFIFPKAAEALAVSDVVQLAGIMDIPLSYLHEKYSIPVPQDGEEVAGARATPSTEAGQDPASQDPNPDDTPPDPAPPDPKSGKAAKQEKLVKNSDQNFLRRISDFFVHAPLEVRGAIRNLFLADTSGSVEHLIDVSALFNRAVKDIYRSKGGDLNKAGIDEHLFIITNNALQDAANKTFMMVGVEWGTKNADFINQFKENAAVFSAFKNHQQTSEIVSLLYKPDGSVRSFSEFKREALNISEGYNKLHLQTEYNTALKAARAAVNWKKFQETKHLYPNLEYMPSRAVHPRDSHRVFWNMIWAMDDPIWDLIMPPSDWNCSCGVRATDKPVSALPPNWNMPQADPVFRNNPGKTAEIVNIKATEYYKNTPEGIRPEVIKFAAGFVQNVKGEITDRYVGKSGGYVNIVRQPGNEAAKNLITYKLLADNGGQYTLLEIQQIGKNPDALNEVTGMLSDAKHPITPNGKNAIQSSIKDASKQKVKEVVIRLSESYPARSIWEGFKAAFQKNRAMDIESVIMIKKDGRIVTLKSSDVRNYFKKTKASKN